MANHEPWDHGKDLVERLRQVREGCRPPIEATNGRRYYSQAYTRLHRKGLARTITTNFHNPGSGRFLHYQLPRTLTVREAARLQGFGDDFVFIGHPGRQERLVGNAFPPLWAESIASHITTELHDVLVRLTRHRPDWHTAHTGTGRRCSALTALLPSPGFPRAANVAELGIPCTERRRRRALTRNVYHLRPPYRRPVPIWRLSAARPAGRHDVIIGPMSLPRASPSGNH